MVEGGVRESSGLISDNYTSMCCIGERCYEGRCGLPDKGVRRADSAVGCGEGGAARRGRRCVVRFSGVRA